MYQCSGTSHTPVINQITASRLPEPPHRDYRSARRSVLLLFPPHSLTPLTSLSPFHPAFSLICYSLSHDKIPVTLNPLIGHFWMYSPSHSHLLFVFLPFLLLPSVCPSVCPLPDTSQTAQTLCCLCIIFWRCVSLYRHTCVRTSWRWVSTQPHYLTRRRPCPRRTHAQTHTDILTDTAVI